MDPCHVKAAHLSVCTALTVLAVQWIPYAGAFCELGTLPGFWDGEKYEMISQECHIDRLIEHWSGLKGATQGKSILLIGDSFDRQYLSALPKARSSDILLPFFFASKVA
jgi:hypothetical protein